MQNTNHLFLQSKGGVGKTVSCCFQANWVMSRYPETLVAYDMDQENQTFSAYTAFKAKHFNVMREGSRTFDPKKFDPWAIDLLSHNGNAVIDTGSNSFSPVLAYIIENDIFDLWKEQGKKTYIHIIIGGGDTYKDTAEGFNDIAEVAKAANTPIIVCENEHNGALATEAGKHFSETSLYKSFAKNIVGRVVLFKYNPETNGVAWTRMNTSRLTIDEVMQSEKYDFMDKRRLNRMFDDVFKQLDAVEW